jgi:hypothetical protein
VNPERNPYPPENHWLRKANKTCAAIPQARKSPAHLGCGSHTGSGMSLFNYKKTKMMMARMNNFQQKKNREIKAFVS